MSSAFNQRSRNRRIGSSGLVTFFDAHSPKTRTSSMSPGRMMPFMRLRTTSLAASRWIGFSLARQKKKATAAIAGSAIDASGAAAACFRNFPRL
ncbi:hypothetical protein RHECNPAF_3500018 [Rhizobium etli CNPAF512]|nr:hypothetical protein RHECNPAF_3500018 [Rhizobium etli CNPAF512]